MKYVQEFAVNSDGHLLTCVDGHLSCDDPEIVHRVKVAAVLHNRIQIVKPFGDSVTAKLTDLNNPVQILAALFAANPGRTQILQAPRAVLAWLEDQEKEEMDADV